MESKILARLGIDPGFIFLFMLVLIIVLFVLVINVNLKYNRLKSSYSTFMKGKDGKTLEQSLLSKFSEMDKMSTMVKRRYAEIEEMLKHAQDCFQKYGIVRYDAFHEMGGKLSFAIALLDYNNNGWVLNAMHSREGCYTYVKEIVKGESYVELSDEEAEALDRAIYSDDYKDDFED